MPTGHGTIQGGSATYAPQLGRDRGHLYLPLLPRLGVGSAAVVDDLVEQVATIVTAALGECRPTS